MSVEALFSQSGPMGNFLEGYSPREEQLQMASAIEEALTKSEHIIIEAGTGVGKTFAYLLPILHSGKKALISTGTKNLQDQLFHRDLPFLKRAFGFSGQIALLKGRSNYLCHQRLEVNRQGGLFSSRKLLNDFEVAADWLTYTKTGDIAELTDIAEDSTIWPSITSTADNCLGQDCPFIKDCFVAKARKRAQSADMVVVNHHLYFASMHIGETEASELLPEVDVTLFDEAHQVPEIALNFLGERFSSRQCLDLAKDLQVLGENDLAELLEASATALRDAFGHELQKASWASRCQDKKIIEAVAATKAVLKKLTDALETVSGGEKALELAWQRAGQLYSQFVLLSKPPSLDSIHWFETHHKTVVLQTAPFSIAEAFTQLMKGTASQFIFTSATLAIGKDFTHFSEQLGLEKTTALQFASPFAYEEQALFYLPRYLPEPSSPLYTAACVDVAMPIIEAAAGGVFFLFTSHRALKIAAGLLAEKIDFPLLVQGQCSRTELLKRFRSYGNAVLLGTSSFWEGVDVRGQALRCVVIDKLPFASPGDPILQARSDLIKKRGGNPFFSLQLPQAVLMLKQGAGRLIRDKNDEGVLVICDPRLIAKPYGEAFIKSLPPMQRTRTKTNVLEFLGSLRGRC